MTRDEQRVVDSWLRWASSTRIEPGLLTRADVKRAARRARLPLALFEERIAERRLKIREAA